MNYSCYLAKDWKKRGYGMFFIREILIIGSLICFSLMISMFPVFAGTEEVLTAFFPRAV